MNKFTAKDGTAQSALSIVQRESLFFGILVWRAALIWGYIGNFEILDRRDPRAEGQEGEGA